MRMLVLAVLVFSLACFGAGCGGGGDDDTGAEQPAATETAAAETGGDAADGKEVFASAGCANCHTLAAADANGTVGPNLDELKPPADEVEEQVRNGGGGMPAFEGELTDAQIKAVAAFVADSAG